jgi:acetyltransferase-like isoleucine patch superfamily enzyme
MGGQEAFGMSDLMDESVAWFAHILGLIPGRIGVKFRAWYYRRKLAGCGKAPIIATGVRLVSPGKLTLGDRVGIGAGAFLTCDGGIRLGNCVGVGPDAKIWSVNHIFKDPDRPWRDQGWEKKEVVIEDDAWIGAASFIKPGVVVGKGAIISAGTVLSKSLRHCGRESGPRNRLA